MCDTTKYTKQYVRQPATEQVGKRTAEQVGKRPAEHVSLYGTGKTLASMSPLRPRRLQVYQEAYPEMAALTDDALCLLAQKGHAPAESVLCARYEGLVFRMVLRARGEDCQERLLSELWTAFLGCVYRYGTGGAFTAYVQLRLQGVVKNFWRAEQYVATHQVCESSLAPAEEEEANSPLERLQQERGESPMTPEEHLLRQEDRRRLGAALREMPATLRVLLVQHYWQGLSLTAIAQLQGVSRQSVSKRHVRALVWLKDAWHRER